MREERLKRLRAALETSGLDGVVLFPGSTFAWAAGYSPLSLERFVALVLPTRGVPSLVAPLVEADYVAERAAVPNVLRFPDHASPAGSLARLLAGMERRDGSTLKLGLEYCRTRLFERETIASAGPHADANPHANPHTGAAHGGPVPHLRLTNADPVIEDLRLRKDPEELALLREAARIAQEAILAGCAELGHGVPETRVSEVMKKLIQGRGASVFQASALSGKDTAFPHASQTGRTMQRGDTVLVAVVLSWKGYFADLTVTAGIGPLSGAARDLMQGAGRMQAAAIAAIRPGCTPDDIDRAAREAGAPYTKDFFHRSGHGVGLDVHEPPFLNLGDRREMPAGAVVSVEPGLYISGTGGGRFEDEVCLTPQGSVERLSDLPKDLVTG